jgi:hypothetical protein
MANKLKSKGDAAEREIAGILAALLDRPVRRKLGAGRTNAAGGDVGDLDGVPDHAVQVAAWSDEARAVREKPFAAAQQAVAAGCRFSATCVRFRGGIWRVILTPEQFAAYVRALYPVAP